MNKEALEVADNAVQKEFGMAVDNPTPLAVKTYLSTVWKPFDAGDESTWPGQRLAPSGNMWLVQFKDGKFTICKAFAVGLRWAYVVAYCDPADLFPDT